MMPNPVMMIDRWDVQGSNGLMVALLDEVRYQSNKQLLLKKMEKLKY